LINCAATRNARNILLGAGEGIKKSALATPCFDLRKLRKIEKLGSKRGNPVWEPFARNFTLFYGLRRTGRPETLHA